MVQQVRADQRRKERTVMISQLLQIAVKWRKAAATVDVRMRNGPLELQLAVDFCGTTSDPVICLSSRLSLTEQTHLIM